MTLIMASAFTSFWEVYNAVLSDLKCKFFGSVHHYPDERGHHTFDNDTLAGVQNKVFLKIMYSLCCQGRENLREMKKDTFRIATDATG